MLHFISWIRWKPWSLEKFNSSWAQGHDAYWWDHFNILIPTLTNISKLAPAIKHAGINSQWYNLISMLPAKVPDVTRKTHTFLGSWVAGRHRVLPSSRRGGLQLGTARYLFWRSQWFYQWPLGSHSQSQNSVKALAGPCCSAWALSFSVRLQMIDIWPTPKYQNRSPRVLGCR